MRTLLLSILMVFASSVPMHSAHGDESPPQKSTIAQVPESRIGSDVIGTQLPLNDLRWINTKDGKALPTAGKVTLVRWWTDTCPYCETSLPAISALEKEYSNQRLQTVAVYHPKPRRAVSNKSVMNAAERIGFEGTVAVDDDWAVLRRAYLDIGKRPATSVSFLLDHDGKIRYIHPGPELRPANRPDESELQAQYDEMQEAIAALIAELPQASAE